MYLDTFVNLGNIYWRSSKKYKSSSYEMCLDVPRHVIHAVYKQVNFYYLGFLCTRRIMTLVNVYVEENLITNLKISKRFKHI